MNLPTAKPLNSRSDASQTLQPAHAASVDFHSSNEIHDLIHEIRQPLEVIESLAYYLELVSDEQRLSKHLQTIRSMVGQANRILEAHAAS